MPEPEPSEFEVIGPPAAANPIPTVFEEMAGLRLEIASLKEEFAKLSKLVEDMERNQNAATNVSMRYYSYTLYLADQFAQFSRPIPQAPPPPKREEGEAVQSYEPEKPNPKTEQDRMYG